MNKAKIIDYLLGHLSAENDHELRVFLADKNSESVLLECSQELENIALSIAEVTPSKELKTTIFADLQATGSEKYAGFIKYLMRFFQLPKATITTILDSLNDISAPAWDKSPFNGAYLHHFKAGGNHADAHCGLIYLKPGTKISNHEHLGEEKMLVIEGEVIIDDGKIYRSGELAISKKGSSHALQAGDNSAAILAVIANDGVNFH